MSALTEITCRKCGTVNAIPALHCKSCGAPLDYDESEQRLVASARPRLHVGRWIRNLVLLLFLVTLALALWPADLPRDTSGQRIDATRYSMMGQILLDAIDRNASTNLPIAERDVNAFFKFNVTSPASDSPFSAQLKDAGVRFDTGTGAIWLLVGHGPLSLSTQIDFAPAPDGTLHVTGAKAGHLPLPGPLGRFYASLRAPLLQKFPNESRILRHLSSATLAPGTLTLSLP